MNETKPKVNFRARLLNHGDVKVTTKYLHDLGIL